MNITNKRNYTDEELEAWLYGEDDEEDLEEKNSFYDIFKPKEVTIPTVYKGLLLDSYLERVAIIVPQECSSVQIGETLTLINEPKSDDAEFITIHSENGLIGFFYNGQYRKKVYKYITTKNHSVLAIAREHNSLILAFYKKSICSDFIALDFETPNRLNDCPCAAGIVVVKNNKIVEKHYSLINPEEEFDSFLTEKIHGISESDVESAPTFPEWYESNKKLFALPIVCHNNEFDITVLEKAAEKYAIDLPEITSYCTLELSRYYLDLRKYTLDNVCRHFNIELVQHHNAECDAEAAAKLFLILNNASEIPTQRIKPVNTKKKSRNPYNVDNANFVKANIIFDEIKDFDFSGKKIVITGKSSIERSEVKTIIENLNARCIGSVSKNVSALLIGPEDINTVKDSRNAKSGKILKAEELRNKGIDIKFFDIEEFINKYYE